MSGADNTMKFIQFPRGFASALSVIAVCGLFATTVHATPQEGTTEDAPGSDVVDSQISQTSIANFTGFVGAQISRFGGNLAPLILVSDLPDDAPSQRGRAAGFEPQRLAGWANFSSTDIEEDVVATRYKGDLNNFMIGVDYQYDNDILAGVVFGLDRGEINTQFNGGTINTNTTIISPYASYRIDDMFSVDGIIGYGRGDIEQQRLVGAALVTSETTYDRYFAQVNGNIVTPVPEVENMLLSGQIGLLYAFEKVNGFTETNGNNVQSKSNPLTQFQLGMRAGYSFFDFGENWVFHPYTQLRYHTELQSNTVDVGAGQAAHPNDDKEVQTSLGVDFFAGSDLSGNIEYTRSFARRDFRSDVISVNLRLKFGSGE